MKHPIFLSAIALLACLSCGTGEKVAVEYKDYRPLQISSFMAQPELVLLETPSEEARIRDMRIGRLLLAENRIFVADNMGNRILMFDRTGKFLKTTADMAGIYKKLVDATLDTQEGMLYAYCAEPSQLLAFDLDLNLEKTVPMETSLLEIGMDEGILYAIRTTENGTELVAFDKNKMEAQPDVVWTQANGTRAKATSEKSLTVLGDGAYASLPGSNRICQIRNGKVKKTYDIDFGRQADAAKRIFNICASDSFLLFNSDICRQWFILDRQTGKCIMDEQLHNDLCLGSNFYILPTQGATDGLVYDMPAAGVNSILAQLKKHQTEFAKNEGAEKMNAPYLPFLDKTIKPTGNPMLYFWTIK